MSLSKQDYHKAIRLNINKIVDIPACKRMYKAVFELSKINNNTFDSEWMRLAKAKKSEQQWYIDVGVIFTRIKLLSKNPNKYDQNDIDKMSIIIKESQYEYIVNLKTDDAAYVAGRELLNGESGDLFERGQLDSLSDMGGEIGESEDVNSEYATTREPASIDEPARIGEPATKSGEIDRGDRGDREEIKEREEREENGEIDRGDREENGETEFNNQYKAYGTKLVVDGEMKVDILNVDLSSTSNNRYAGRIRFINERDNVKLYETLLSKTTMNWCQEILLPSTHVLPVSIVVDIERWFSLHTRAHSIRSALYIFFDLLIDVHKCDDDADSTEMVYSKTMNRVYLQNLCRIANNQWLSFMDALSFFKNLHKTAQNVYKLSVEKYTHTLDYFERLNPACVISKSNSYLMTLNIAEWQHELYLHDKDVCQSIMDDVELTRSEVRLMYKIAVREFGYIPFSVQSHDFNSISKFYLMRKKGITLQSYHWSLKGFRTYNPLITLSKRIRSIIFPEYVELDIGNCHWFLMMHILTENTTIDCRKELDYLMTFNDIYSVFKIDRKDAKSAVNVWINHSYTDNVIKSMAYPKQRKDGTYKDPILKWVNVLIIDDWFSKNCPLLHSLYTKWKSRKKMHYDLTKIEQDIIFQCNVRIDFRGLNQHDGIMVHKNADHSIFINAFNNYVKDWYYKPVIKIKTPEFEWHPTEKQYM
jgi:hypothetical protein